MKSQFNEVTSPTDMSGTPENSSVVPMPNGPFAGGGRVNRPVLLTKMSKSYYVCLGRLIAKWIRTELMLGAGRQVR